MNLIRLNHRTVAIVAMLAVSLLLRVETALAHGGHAHPEEGGFDATVLYQAGGAALAVGVAYLVASAMYRRADARRNRPDR